MKNALLGTLLLATSLTASAQQPKMLGDINPAPAIGSFPCWLTGFGPKLVFFANDGTNGLELWGLDTALSLQYDINPGIADGGQYIFYQNMAEVGNMLYMTADNGSTGYELYKWDGKTAPALVADINPGSAGSSISELLAMDGKIYFAADNGVGGSGMELWSYNPATDYTQRLTDLTVGPGSSNPYWFAVYKGKLYFSATSTTAGTELYAFDPTNNTTTLVADIQSGAGSSSPEGMTVINDKLYFSASTLVFGREMYSYDGKNISRLTNVDNGGLDGVYPVQTKQTQFISFKNKIYFCGDNSISGPQLYEYNPANGVTQSVYTINPTSGSYPQNFVSYAGKLFFSADDGTNGAELWMYNGTIAPMMVADIDTGASSSSPANLYVWNNKLYFAAYSANTGTELYSYQDSSVLGVKNVRFDGNISIYPNPANSVAHVQVSLKNSQIMGYAVTDITGKTIVNAEAKQYAAGTHTIDVNMAQLAAGVYIYRLYDNAGAVLATGRIEKQ